MKELVLRAVRDEKKGMGSYHAVIDDEAADFLADVSGGDARAALNAVELGVLTTERDPADGLIHITLDVAQECIQKRAVRYDKDGAQPLRHDLRLYQEHARFGPRCGSLLSGPDALRGRRY